ncbi:PH domain-containing protein [Candidatus Uhrbacteria bacterium]|nr:PH domain-containing protein [Candidatus Uhrbacteria bacterium]
MIDFKHLPNAVPDEEVVHVLRRHPITLLTVMIGFVVLLASPFLAAWILPLYQPELVANPVFMTLIILFGSIFFLFAWLFLFQNFMDYYLDVWIVTTKRILNIEQTGLFSRTVSELRLYRIQDVTSTVSGFLHTLFDFGDVEIQTAGEKTRFIFEEIPHPTRISKSILERAEVERREQLDDAIEEFQPPDSSSKK